VLQSGRLSVEQQLEMSIQDVPQTLRPTGQAPLHACVRGMHRLSQRWVLGLQVKSQDDPSQVGVAFAGVGQRSHRFPQELTLRLSRQPSGHWWNPLLQVGTQAPFWHLTSAFGGATQGLQDGPQKLTSF
jgi:hypothetical protein